MLMEDANSLGFLAAHSVTLDKAKGRRFAPALSSEDC